ncbi:acylneuraminate cytidylyltransferase family protein [Panacibacter ginsenosidivorans]|uniref:acylneuraminate cytidylyltransferase family protein n=1 Tax=Panacibacter ginsenosidivorans TaxID=1813871 RepID=UPI0013153BEE|nr:acylneuraminate cytidylyltransferase family protein [Panacibacter ginsenosidivorans]
MEILAIIPARGGSKGLPGKNIRLLTGHPLIAYSILAAQQSKYITRTIVSTDDENIAAVSKQYGAELPFIRPSAIAQDLSTDFEVFTHALEWLQENENYIPDYIVQLRPTSPVRLNGMIDQCINKMLQHPEADSLRIITEAPVTPYKMWLAADNDTAMRPLLTLDGVTESYNMPRQNLPKVYWQTGTLDIIKTNVITEMKMMSGKMILPHIVPSYLAVDIDDLKSFEQAAEVIAQYDCIKFEN